MHPEIENLYNIKKQKQIRNLVLGLSLLVLFTLSTAFSWFKDKERSSYLQQPDAVYTVPQYNSDDSKHIPGYGNTFLGFKEAIGFKESRGRYMVVNSLGYLGKYQFGESTLNTLQIFNTEYFLFNTKLQERAFKANCSYNKWLLMDEIDKYEGTTIKGIEITESGMIAAAHLAGAGSVKRFLRHQGRNRAIKDAYGTNIESYLRKFAHYDISYIEATKYPTL